MRWIKRILIFLFLLLLVGWSWLVYQSSGARSKLRNKVVTLKANTETLLTQGEVLQFTTYLLIDEQKTKPYLRPDEQKKLARLLNRLIGQSTFFQQKEIYGACVELDQPTRKTLQSLELDNCDEIYSSPEYYRMLKTKNKIEALQILRQRLMVEELETRKTDMEIEIYQSSLNQLKSAQPNRNYFTPDEALRINASRIQDEATSLSDSLSHIQIIDIFHP